jgi:hypothetical protein
LWRLLIVAFLVALVATVFIPLKELKLQEEQEKITRLHLVDLWLAEYFYFQGRQRYTDSVDSLLSYINNVRQMRIDTVSVTAIAPSDSIRPTDEWRIVGPRERIPLGLIKDYYVSPVDFSAYVLVVKDDGISCVIKDRNGFGRIENGVADWLEGRKGG